MRIRSLTRQNNLPELPEEKFTVKELSIHDYENRLWEPSFLDANKKQLYLERFANPKAKAYGVFVNGELAFSSHCGIFFSVHHFLFPKLIMWNFPIVCKAICLAARQLLLSEI